MPLASNIMRSLYISYGARLKNVTGFLSSGARNVKIAVRMPSPISAEPGGGDTNKKSFVNDPDAMARASLGLGAASILCTCFTAIPGVILGIIALQRGLTRPRSRLCAVGGIVLSGLFVLFWAVMAALFPDLHSTGRNRTAPRVIVTPLAAELFEVSYGGRRLDDRGKYSFAEFDLSLTALGRHIAQVADGKERPREGVTRSEYAALARGLELEFRLLVDGRPNSTGTRLPYEPLGSRITIGSASKTKQAAYELGMYFGREGWSIAGGWISVLSPGSGNQMSNVLIPALEKLGLGKAIREEQELVDRFYATAAEAEAKLRELRERGSDADIQDGYRSLSRDTASRIRSQFERPRED
jgi:hypothetical protein